MRVSIIIPALNEAFALPRTLQLVRSLQGTTPAEIIVADGGSRDATVALARQSGVQVVTGVSGRARQMNLGARVAAGEVLLFLHADTDLPRDALRHIEQAVHRGSLWGRFDVKIAGRPFMLRVVGMLMNLRSRWTGIATGDQALFIVRSAFDRVGGFPDQPLMEDIEMSRRLKRLGPPACVAARVVTSGRRWETRGVWRTIFLMWRLRWAYWRGAPPEQLARMYR